MTTKPQVVRINSRLTNKSVKVEILEIPVVEFVSVQTQQGMTILPQVSTGHICSKDICPVCSHNCFDTPEKVIGTASGLIYCPNCGVGFLSVCAHEKLVNLGQESLKRIKSQIQIVGANQIPKSPILQ